MSLEASPYLWTALGAVFIGLALGQALRWTLLRLRLGGRAGAEDRPARLSAGRMTRAAVFASLGILALAGLLVLPPKESLHETALAGWAASLALCGILAGYWPRLGALLVVVAAALALLLRSALVGWSPLAFDTEIARLLPLEASAAANPAAGATASAAPGAPGGGGQRFRCEFRAIGPAAPAGRMLELTESQAALTVDTLELRGPLPLIVAFPRQVDRLFLFKIEGFAGDAEAPSDLADPRALFDRLTAPPRGSGLSPGASPSSRETGAGLVIRSRATSALPSIVPLQPIVYAVAADRVPELLSATGDALGVLAR